MTSPGHAVQALVTDLGTLEKQDGELVLTAVPGRRRHRWPTGWRGRSRRAGGTSGSRPTVRELEPPTAAEIAALRGWDPQGWFLRG